VGKGLKGFKATYTWIVGQMERTQRCKAEWLYARAIASTAVLNEGGDSILGAVAHHQLQHHRGAASNTAMHSWSGLCFSCTISR